MDRSSFVWDGFSWRATVRFSYGNQSYGAVKFTEISTPLCYAPEGRDDSPLEDVEIASIARVVDNLPVIWMALGSRIYSYYHANRAELNRGYPDDLPQLQTAEDLWKLISIQTVYIHQIVRDGQSYVGFEFECQWDKEHGLGVLMHGTRVVEIGTADTAFLLWVARKDNGES